MYFEVVPEQTTSYGWRTSSTMHGLPGAAFTFVSISAVVAPNPKVQCRIMKSKMSKRLKTNYNIMDSGVFKV